MFRFTIRDLFWVMFIVGFSLWTLKYRQQIRTVQQKYLDRATEEIANREAAEARCGVADDRARRLADKIEVLCGVIHTLEVERELWRSNKTPTAQLLPASSP